MKTISVYNAIAQMRALTKEGKTFSFSFMSYSRDKQQTHGIVSCNKASLRPAPKQFVSEHQDIMLHYVDDNGQAKHCYQPAIMTFQGIKCELK